MHPEGTPAIASIHIKHVAMDIFRPMSHLYDQCIGIYIFANNMTSNRCTIRAADAAARQRS